jgi:hypothetical protein
MKNWPNDPHFNCKKKVDLKEYMKAKTSLVDDNYDLHYEKSHLLKSHYLATKTQKKTHIQLLCNYPLGITTNVQLSFYKYNVLINKLPR